MDSPFAEGMYIIFHGHAMAFMCYIVMILHLIAAYYDSGGRKWSRVLKGVVYAILGFAFVLSESPDMSVIAVRRMLRIIIGVVLVTEIFYHAPNVALLLREGGRRKFNVISWMSNL